MNKFKFKDKRGWLKDIWEQVILVRFPENLEPFKNLSIFPRNFTSSEGDLQTVKLSDKILKIDDLTKLQKDLDTAFSKLGVKRVRHIPEWLDKHISKYVCTETPNSLSQLLERISSDEIDNFNKLSTSEEKQCLLTYLSKLTQTTSLKCQHTLKHIEIFPQFDDSMSRCLFTSINNCNRLFVGQSFPVKFPLPLIKVKSEEEKHLAKNIGIHMFTEEILLQTALESIEKYGVDEMKTLMLWALENPKYLEDKKILQFAKKVAFLDNGKGELFQASELFDPSEKLLRTMFKNEYVFPVIQEKALFHRMRILGLKQLNNVLPADLQKIIEHLDGKSKHEPTDFAKSEAAMTFANECLSKEAPERWQTLLSEELVDKQWITVPQKRPNESRILCSPRKIKSAEFRHLIESVYDVFECTHFPKLAELYGWTKLPPVCDILQHLSNVISNYRSENKVECNTMIKHIYMSLAEYTTEDVVNRWKLVFSSNKDCVWNGDGFSPVTDMCVAHRDEDLDLQPYLYVLPTELQTYEAFFISVGCKKTLDCVSYTSVLKKLKEESDAGKYSHHMKRLALNILNKLKEDFSSECKNDQVVRENVFIPVMSEEQTLVMKNISECAFIQSDRHESLIDESDDFDVYFIHQDVPISTAEALGVRTMKQQMLSDADAFEEWGQEEPLTTRLATLLKEGYVEGFPVIKELMQNADDAKASKLHIFYDERLNEDAQTLLINAELAAWQGPAIWVYNDAEFSESDFKNITKLNGGTKEHDTTKIGKFGLGFCAVYNITDVPSFVSGDNYVIFDPHTTNIGKALPGKSPGLRLNFGKNKNQKILKRMYHQFKVFDKVFDFRVQQSDMSYFKGTLFRLPLRRRGSEICNVVYTHEKVVELLKKFVELAPNMFIFTQHVAELKIFHLKSGSPCQKKEVYHVSKQVLEVFPQPFKNGSAMLDAASRKQENCIQSKPLKGTEEILIKSKEFKCKRLKMMKIRDAMCFWVVSWATGTKEETLEVTEKEKGALPLAAVAVPFKQDLSAWVSLKDTPEGFYKKGHFFFYLPLPVEQSFKFHINSQFSVTSDRRGLRKANEDEISETAGKWNGMLMEDAVVKALVYLLEAKHYMSSENPYMLWPYVSNEGLEVSFCRSFYSHITLEGTKCKIFMSLKDGQYYGFDEVVFLDVQLRRTQTVGDIACSLLMKLLSDKKLTDLPDEYYQHLKEASKEKVEQKTITSKQFILKYFLPNMTEMSVEDKDKVMLFVLTFDDSDVRDWLRHNPCIPVEPHGLLKKTCDLIDPRAEFASLFRQTDECFPSNIYSCNEAVMESLRQLGMVHERLSNDMIIDRAKTVSNYARDCSACALDQSKRFGDYLFKLVEEHEDLDGCVVLQKGLQNVEFLSAMMKPKNWPFPWKAEELIRGNTITACDDHKNKWVQLVLANPQNVHPKDDFRLVGCTSFVLDQKISTNVLDKIGVRPVTDYTEVVQQLLIMSKDYSPLHDEIKNEAAKASRTVYRFLDSKCTDSFQAVDTCIAHNLDRQAIVFVGTEFTETCNVAKRLEVDCKPCLFALADSPLQGYPILTKTLKIRDQFDCIYVVKKLESIYQNNINASLQAKDFNIVIRLLNLLKELMRFNKEDLSKVTVYIPDEDKVLRPSTELCFNDFDDLEKSGTMIYVHGDVSPNIAKAVGVKRKIIKHFEDTTEDFEDFYQEEPLVTRLKSLTDAYPCDIAIFKELLQNADDAGATEVHFVLDKETHSVKNIIDSKMAPLQGPALCVYNNSSFSQKDLKGITKLGEGSKGRDPSSTGKYGVGFNAVYNLTDAPSFLTKGEELENGETLCFFDPLALFVPLVSRKKPGKRLRDVSSLRKHHPDTLKGYHEHKYFCGNKGTMFRFPLRSQRSDIKEDPVLLNEVEKLLETFVEEIPSVMLFLRNLTCIGVTYYQDSKYIERSSVRLTQTDDWRQKRETVKDKLIMFCKELKMSTQDMQQTIIGYEMKLTQYVRLNRTLESSYFVVHAVGFSKEPDDDLVKQIRSGKLSLVPHAAIAYKFPNSNEQSSNNENRVYCYLPLSIKSGLPVCVHGFFSLDHESRRGLWHSENPHCYKTLWNEAMIKNVISDIYVELIETLRKRATNSYQLLLQGHKNFSLYVTGVVIEFQNVFPLHASVEGHYWKLLTESVYQKLVSKEKEFLPVISNCLDEDRKFLYTELSWTTLKGLRHSFSAVHADESNNTSDKAYVLNNILRSIGMRIVTVKDSVRDSMEHAGVPVETICPKIVIDFLCSYKLENLDRCLIEINKEVRATVLKNMDSVVNLWRFISDENGHLEENIESIPLIITQDYIVRSLECVEHELYVTKFVHFFPHEYSKFLNIHLCSILENQIQLCGSLRKFKLRDFVELCEKSGYVEVNVKGYIEWNGQNPTETFLRKFWKFFRFCLNESNKSKPAKKADIMTCMLNEMQTLSIIGIYDPASARNMLCNTKQLFTLLTVDKFSREIKNICENLKLPCLDTSLLLEPQKAMLTYTDATEELVLLLGNHTATAECPGKVLKCFEHHRQRLVESELTRSQSVAILAYFSQSDWLDSADDVSMLKTLPLFVTLDGMRRSLVDFEETYLVPSDLPSNGIQTLIEKKNIALIGKEAVLERLFRRLRFGDLDWINVYVSHIIPSQNLMSREDFYVHINFLASRYVWYKKDMDILFESLRLVPFIETEKGQMVLPSQLFDHTVDIFKRMCGKHELLPSDLQTEDVLEFMRKLGLQTSLCLNVFLRFAKEIESKSKAGNLTAELKRNSRLLVQKLVLMPRSFYQDNSLDELASICFVMPLKVEEMLEAIFPQHKSTSLICYKDSVVQTETHICWTTCNLLSKDVIPRYIEDVRAKLQVAEKPNVGDWVRHVKNVCNALHDKVLPQKCPVKIEDQHVDAVMKDIYQSVEKYKLDEKQKNAMKQTPLIYYKGQKLLIPPKNVVNDCKSNVDEVPPYVMKSPVEFSNYFESFLSLGCHREITCDLLASALYEIKTDMRQGQELLPKELADITKLMAMFFKLLSLHKTDTSMSEDVLYLLSSQDECSPSLKNLEDATSLVVNNNDSLKKRALKGTDKLKFLTSCLKTDFLEVKRDEIIDCLAWIPKKIRPHLLTDIVTEHVDLSCITRLPSTLGTEVQRYIQSSDFCFLFLRLAKHSKRQNGKDWSCDIEKEISNTLQNFQLIHTEGICTELKMPSGPLDSKERLETLPNTQEKKLEFIEKQNAGIIVYFQLETEKCYRKIRKEISVFLDETFDLGLGKLFFILEELLDKDQSKTDLLQTLDEHHVDVFESSIPIHDLQYPTPGDFVPKKYHVFLDNDYGVFQEYEYKFIAYLVEDPMLTSEDTDGNDSDSESASCSNKKSDDMTPTYIFVHIKRKVSGMSDKPFLFQEYEVDIGEESTKIIPAYLLFKFMRGSQQNLSSERSVVLYERPQADQPDDSIATICKEIRVILIEAWTQDELERKRIVRRLMLKWHPDKNPENVVLATKVFQYIQHCIECLMEGKTPSEYKEKGHDCTDSKKGGSSYSGFYGGGEEWSRSWYGSYWRRYKESYRSQSPSSGWTHFSWSSEDTHYEPYHFYSEARRWQRQARSDVEDARISLDHGGHANNFICYKAHQVKFL